LGVSYRSEVEVKYEGEASFTQTASGNSQLDALVATLLPAETLQGVTKIDFPDNLNVGLAWSNEKWTLSGQWARMGWSSYQELNLIFPENPEYNETIVENYEDADQYSFGLEHRASQKWRFQLGYQYDETPQPIEVMTPLLGDGDREVYAFGIGWQGKRIWLDFGYQYVKLLRRSTEGTSINGFDGSYEGDAHLFATSLGWKF
jgi:long-subunit fatty acid transport protein